MLGVKDCWRMAGVQVVKALKSRAMRMRGAVRAGEEEGRVVRPSAGLLNGAAANECMQTFDGLEAAVCQ